MAPLVPLLALGWLAALAAAMPAVSKRATIAYQNITPQQWQAFNTTLKGSLRVGVPMARPCKLHAAAGVNGTYDPVACQAVTSDYTTDTGIVKYFGGYLTAEWGTCQKTNQECTLDFQAPNNPLAYAKECYQGSVPTYYVNVSTQADVQSSFAFAKQMGIQLTIKNSGHDYKGRSSGPNTLGVWMHNIQFLTKNNNFVAAGCAANTTAIGVTVGAGNGFDSVFKYADANNITLIGGSSRTVVASGGWIGGGGHSALSNTLGMGVDRSLEMQVITPDGNVVTASRCQNADLFFALRGGGASTYGVVWQTTYSAAPALTLQVVYIRIASINTNLNKQFLQILIANQLRWSQNGWGGYIEPGAMGSTTGGLVLMTPKLNHTQAVADMKPITDFASSLGNLALSNEVTENPNFLSVYNKYILPNAEQVDVAIVLGSRLIPDTNFKTNASQATLLSAMTSAVAAVPALIPSTGLVYGGAPVQILVTSPYNVPSDGTSAETPVWRSTLWHVIVGTTYNPYIASSTDIARAYRQSTTAANFLRAVTPQDAAYSNEAAVHEPNYQVSFWGQANYNKLVPIKQKYDPNNILSCWQCVGWSQAEATSNPRYACYV